MWKDWMVQCKSRSGYVRHPKFTKCSGKRSCIGTAVFGTYCGLTGKQSFWRNRTDMADMVMRMNQSLWTIRWMWHSVRWKRSEPPHDYNDTSTWTMIRFVMTFVFSAWSMYYMLSCTFVWYSIIFESCGSVLATKKCRRRTWGWLLLFILLKSFVSDSMVSCKSALNSKELSGSLSVVHVQCLSCRLSVSDLRTMSPVLLLQFFSGSTSHSAIHCFLVASHTLQCSTKSNAFWKSIVAIHMLWFHSCGCCRIGW